AITGEWFDVTPPPVIAVGDLIRDGRAEDASRLLEILQRREAIVDELPKVRASWRWVPASDRRRVELEAAWQRTALDREDASLQLEAYSLGLWPDGATTEKRLPDLLANLRQAAGQRSNSP